MAKVREIKKEHRFKSDTLNALTKDSSKVQTSTALNSFVSILVAKKEEEEEGRKQAQEWSEKLEWNRQKKRKIDEVDAPAPAPLPMDPYNLTEDQIREKFKKQHVLKRKRNIEGKLLSLCS